MPRSVIGGAGNILRVPSKRSPRSSMVIVAGGGNSFDADASAFFTATGITDATQKDAINDLVIALKADGIWSKMHAIYPFVGGTATTHKFNLKDPADTDAAFRITWSGGITHDANGITGNGSTGYGDTHFDPSVEIGSNAGSFGIYLLANGSGGSAEIGAFVSATESYAIASNFTGSYFAGCNGAQITNTAKAAGFHQLSRTGASDIFYDVNGTNTTHGSNSYSAPNYDVFILARNGSGSPTFYSNRTISFAYMGDSLSTGEAVDFYNAVQAFQTALSRDV